MDTQNKKSYSFSVQQSPNSENEHTAIVSVSLCDGTMTVSNFGSANQATVNSYNTVDIINAARDEFHVVSSSISSISIYGSESFYISS